jgi:chromosome segregation ATPase
MQWRDKDGGNMETMNEAGRVVASTVEALAATAETLERAMSRLEARLEAQQAELEGRVQQIMGTIETPDREALEQRLAEAERQIAELKAAAAPVGTGRKTRTTATADLLAKHGLNSDGAVEAGAVDQALASLPVEQRIAVKSQLLRAGLLG